MTIDPRALAYAEALADKHAAKRTDMRDGEWHGASETAIRALVADLKAGMHLDE